MERARTELARVTGLPTSVRQPSTPPAPTKRGGRRPEVFATKIVPRITELRTPDPRTGRARSWKIVTKTINTEFGTRYTDANLQTQFSRAQKRRANRGQA
jgi:hypothetical protein